MTNPARERRLEIPAALRDSIFAAARQAYPEECCGLIEGECTKDGWRVLAIHQAANVAQDRRRHFVVDPKMQFQLLRSLRATSRAIIGCYHSHPDGRAEPSDTDREGASAEEDFLWLIAGGTEKSFQLQAYVSNGNAFESVGLALP